MVRGPRVAAEVKHDNRRRDHRAARPRARGSRRPGDGPTTSRTPGSRPARRPAAAAWPARCPRRAAARSLTGRTLRPMPGHFRREKGPPRRSTPTASSDVRIRFVANPIIRHSACARLRIDSGSTASVTSGRPADPPRQDQHRRRHRREQGDIGVACRRGSRDGRTGQARPGTAGRSSAGARGAATRPSRGSPARRPSARASCRTRP